MARITTPGKAISDDVRAIVLNMACSLNVKQITRYTGIPSRSIYRILQDFRRRAIISRNGTPSLRGAQRKLTMTDARVRLSDL